MPTFLSPTYENTWNLTLNLHTKNDVLHEKIRSFHTHKETLAFPVTLRDHFDEYCLAISQTGGDLSELPGFSENLTTCQRSGTQPTRIGKGVFRVTLVDFQAECEQISLRLMRI